MTGLSIVNIHNIYLFDENQPRFGKTNPLREFVNFLKNSQQDGQKVRFDFSYSCDNDSLHQSLSIKENFILDAVPKSLIRDGEDNFNQFLHTLKNPHLKKLITHFSDISEKVCHLNKEELKLTSIMKSLLSQSEYIFLLTPDMHLSNEVLTLIKQAIQFEVYNRHRKVYIKASNRDIWLDIAGHIISKHRYHFSCQENPLLEFLTEDEKSLNKTLNHSLKRPNLLKQVS